VHGLGTMVQIKIMGELLLVFTIMWFDIYCMSFLRLLSKKYKIMSGKKKEFEDLDDFLVSFRFYFVIVEESSYIFTV
jgi:hypothetical protein